MNIFFLRSTDQDNNYRLVDCTNGKRAFYILYIFKSVFLFAFKAIYTSNNHYGRLNVWNNIQTVIQCDYDGMDPFGLIIIIYVDDEYQKKKNLCKNQNQNDQK